MGLNALLYELLICIIGFTAMNVISRTMIKEYQNTLKFTYKMVPLFYIYALYVLGAVVMYFAVPLNDYVETLTFKRVLVPLLGGAVIYVSYFLFEKKFFYATVAICAAIAVWLQPVGTAGIGALNCPQWAVHIVACLFLIIITLGSRILNFLPHTFILPQIVTLIGLCFLAFLGATPLYVALCAALMIGLLGGYLLNNFYQVQLEFDDISCITVSYLIGSLLLMNLGEFSIVSCVTFTSIFWAELFAAIYNKLLVSRGGELRENTNYYLAAENVTISVLSTDIIKIGFISIIIGCIQLYVSSAYTFLLLSILFTFWRNGMIGKNIKGFKALKEINKEFISDIKQGFGEIKKALNKDKKGD